MKKLLKLSYTRVQSVVDMNMYELLLCNMPEDLRIKNLRLRNWADKMLNLFGLLLLKKGLMEMGLGSSVLSELKYSPNMRPYTEGNIDFNISHSGEYVICAIGNDLSIGVDIEKIEPLQLDEFRDVLTKNEWNLVWAAENPLSKFYSFWTIKESVIKADSRGMSIPLNRIQIDHDNEVFFDNKYWFINALDIDDGYSSHLCTDIRMGIPFLSRVDFDMNTDFCCY